MTDPTGTDGEWRFDDLRALYVNCTLKRSPERSHTRGWPGGRLPAHRQRGRGQAFRHERPLQPPAPGALLKRAGGITAHGNQRSEWEAGCRFDSDSPEHR